MAGRQHAVDDRLHLPLEEWRRDGLPGVVRAVADRPEPEVGVRGERAVDLVRAVPTVDAADAAVDRGRGVARQGRPHPRLVGRLHAVAARVGCGGERVADEEDRVGNAERGVMDVDLPDAEPVIDRAGDDAPHRHPDPRRPGEREAVRAGAGLVVPHVDDGPPSAVRPVGGIGGGLDRVAGGDRIGRGGVAQVVGGVGVVPTEQELVRTGPDLDRQPGGERLGRPGRRRAVAPVHDGAGPLHVPRGEGRLAAADQRGGRRGHRVRGRGGGRGARRAGRPASRGAGGRGWSGRGGHGRRHGGRHGGAAAGEPAGRQRQGGQQRHQARDCHVSGHGQPPPSPAGGAADHAPAGTTRTKETKGCHGCLPDSAVGPGRSS